MVYPTLTMLPVFQSSILQIFFVLSCIWSLLKLISFLQPRARTTSLKGPASKSFVFGNSKYLNDSPSTASIYNDWAQQYGAVYSVPAPMGGSRVILCDPKAVHHFYSRDCFEYVQTPLRLAIVERFVSAFRVHKV